MTCHGGKDPGGVAGTQIVEALCRLGVGRDLVVQCRQNSAKSFGRGTLLLPHLIGVGRGDAGQARELRDRVSPHWHS